MLQLFYPRKHLIKLTSKLTRAPLLLIVFAITLCKSDPPLQYTCNRVPFYQEFVQCSIDSSHSANLTRERFTSIKMSAVQMSRQRALWGSFIGDAIAMPVHWYYNPPDIKSGYGNWLSGYVAPNKHHPTSILTISAIGESLVYC